MRTGKYMAYFNEFASYFKCIKYCTIYAAFTSVSPMNIKFKIDVPAKEVRRISGLIIPKTTSTVVITNKSQNIFQIHAVP